MVCGYPEKALEEADGNGVEERICRLEAYIDLGDYTEARDLLRGLEQENFGAFPAPWDFRFFLNRGRLEEWSVEMELARKNYLEAARRARTPEQNLTLHDVLCLHYLRLSDLKAAEEEMAQAEELSESVRDVWVLAEHLLYLSYLQNEKGDAATAIGLNRAAAEIFMSHGALSRAGSATMDSLDVSSEPENFPRQLRITQAAVGRHLAAKAYPQLSDDLRRSILLYFRLPEAGPEELKHLFEEVLKQTPPGQWRDRMELSYLDLLQTYATPPSDLAERLTRLAAATHPEVRMAAGRALAEVLMKTGEFEKALSLEQELVSKAHPQMHYDRDWGNAPGPLLLDMSKIQRARHRYREALELARRGLAAEPGNDWTYWRTEAGYEALMVCLESFDTDSASEVLTGALQDISKLPKGSARAGSLTTIMSALLLNRSVSEDLLDPSELILREYPDNVKLLLKQCFADPALVEKCLDDYDVLAAETGRKTEGRRSMPLVYKGLFLEALGRESEASSTLQAGLEAAKVSGLAIDRAIAQVLLARLALRKGDRQEAVERLLDSAESAAGINPLAGQFYLLVAASAQRDAGDLEGALAGFQRAEALSRDRRWQCAYGQATTLERLGRPQDAMRALERTEQALAERGFAQSMTRLKVMKARLLAQSGHTDQADALLREAFESILVGGTPASLLEAGRSFGDLLLARKESDAALLVTTRTLDRLAEWNELSYHAARPLFERAVTLALQLGKSDTGLRYLGLSRSAELVDSVELSGLGQDTETGRLLRDINSIKAKLAGLRNTPDAQATGQILAQTREEFFAKLHDLKVKNPDFEALVQVSGSQLSAVQSSIPTDAALLEYFPAADRLYIFVVTQDELSVHQTVFPRNELDRLIGDYRDLVTDPHSELARLREQSARLREILIDPCGNRLAGVKRLKIVPTGSLWQLPFAALWGKDGQPLCKRFRFSYLSSSELLKLDSEPVGPPKAPLLVSGAGDLPWSHREVKAIAQLLPGSLTIGPERAGLVSLEEALKGRDLIHLATHSRVSPKPDECYVELGPDRLRLEQIYGLRLKPSSLVVLSSCESGLSGTTPGRELTSLGTAFSVAGASSVVSSLWPVNDRATADFFEVFYAELGQGKSRGEALGEAEVQMQKRYPHPYFWAGFSLMGAD